MYNNLLRLIRGRDIQLKTVIFTALASYILQLSAILLHWHLWAIALATIIPWIPLFSMKVLYNSRHYGFMAAYMVLMLVQAGHVGEHVFQMGQFILYHEYTYTGKFEINPSPTAATITLNTQPHTGIPLKAGTKLVEVTKPDPPQSDVYADPVTNTAIVYPNCTGWNWNGPGCPAAHGVFGELDRELVHFVWDGLILIACIVIFVRFRDNPWTKWALLAAFIHQIEHIFLFGSSLAPQSTGYPGKGSFLGLAANQLDAGLMGHNGVVGTAFPAVNDVVPNRINIHFIYNVLVIIPMVLAFAYEVRRIYDEWLAKALPNLSRDQLIYFSQEATPGKFAANQIIFNQGDAADRFYIITKGQVEILRADRRGFQKPIAALSEGAYFGEIGILGRTRRTATVKALTEVEVLSLDENTFRSMIAASGESYKDVDVIVKRRIKQLGAVQGKNVDRKIDADPDLLVKSRIIQGWLDDMEYKSQLLNWNGLAEPVNPQNGGRGSGPSGPAQPSFPNAQAAVTVLPPPVVQPQPFRGNSNPTAPSPTPAPPTVPTPVIYANPGNGHAPPPPVPMVGAGSLKVRSGNSTGERFELNAPRVVVGRRSNRANNAAGKVYMVDDSRVSREHIEIVQQPDGIYLRDLGSSNGTWLNGTQLEGTPVRLEDGAEIRLGTDTVLTYHYGQ